MATQQPRVIWQDARAVPELDLEEVAPGFYWMDYSESADGVPVGPFASEAEAIAAEEASA